MSLAQTLETIDPYELPMGLNPYALPESFLRCMDKQDRKPMGKAGLTLVEVFTKERAKNERQLQDSIAAYLRLREIPFYQARMDRKTTGKVGWPDFTFPYCGRFVALEAKLPGEMPTSEQNGVLLALMKQGAYVKIVHSLAEAVACIREVDEMRMPDGATPAQQAPP
jgi:hypothetical protein